MSENGLRKLFRINKIKIIISVKKIQIQYFIKASPLVIYIIHNHHNIYIKTEVL
jgi:CRISPR/Cas system endoribonuclease Cas6 (RAMP superfamily)